MKKIEIPIKLLTPLWTGGVDGNSKRIKETGIIGSLRWWFRAYLRSQGVSCSQDEGVFDGLNYRKELEKIQQTEQSSFLSDNTDEGFLKRVNFFYETFKSYSPDALIFGTTGWKSQVGLRVESGDNQMESLPKFYDQLSLEDNEAFNNDITNIKFMKKRFLKKAGNGYIPAFYQKTPLLFKFISNNEVDGERYLKILAYFLKEISEIGAIGAKVQNGFGMISIGDNNIAENFLDEGKELLSLLYRRQEVKDKDKYEPNLIDFFSKQYKVTNEQYKTFRETAISQEERDNCEECEILGLLIRYMLRKEVLNGENIDICPLNHKKEKIKNFRGIDKVRARVLFGNDLQDRYSSLINVSNIYKDEEGGWQFRIWGWLPENYKIPIKRDEYIISINRDETVDFIDGKVSELFGSNINISDNRSTSELIQG